MLKIPDNESEGVLLKLSGLLLVVIFQSNIFIYSSLIHNTWTIDQL